MRRAAADLFGALRWRALGAAWVITMVATAVLVLVDAPTALVALSLAALGVIVVVSTILPQLSDIVVGAALVSVPSVHSVPTGPDPAIRAADAERATARGPSRDRDLETLASSGRRERRLALRIYRLRLAATRAASQMQAAQIEARRMEAEIQRLEAEVSALARQRSAHSAEPRR